MHDVYTCTLPIPHIYLLYRTSGGGAAAGASENQGKIFFKKFLSWATPLPTGGAGGDGGRVRISDDGGDAGARGGANMRGGPGEVRAIKHHVFP
jgi:hypothetical protein